MGGFQVFEQAVHARLVALSVTDSLLRALRLAGEFPPPLGDIECRIVAQTAPIARDFDPPLLLTTFRNQSGFLIADGSYAREREPGRPFPLGDGTYKVQVRGQYYQRETFDLVWPPGGNQTRIPLPDAQGNPVTVALLPGPAYPLPDTTTARLQLGPTILRGSLYSTAGDPIAGVDVEVVGLAFLQPPELPALPDWSRFLKAKTNEKGDWAILLPGRRYLDPMPELPAPNQLPVRKAITFDVHYDPNSPPTSYTRTFELGGEQSLRNTALRGQVVGRGGRPVTGAQITTSLGSGTSVSRDNGIWFLYFGIDQFPPNAAGPSVTVTATTPDGASASDSSGVVQPGGTVVIPTFRFP
ncbi:MAG TPA: hypothetical protein VIK51_02060 [Vicinamibacteria bacterium]|jgi:hypothetical protein